MVVDLPGGTVTFLFTDVEGSTNLLHDLGPDEYARALHEHRQVIRAAFARHGGSEVDTQGDSFFYAFVTAPDAARAALEAQDDLAKQVVAVRMGLHTGTAQLTPEGYVGLDVHRAARIAAAAHGGQVVASASTAALLDAVHLVNLGEHRLKDLRAAERLFQIGDGVFPPLKSLHRTNLPILATPFLGRRDELADVTRLAAAPGVRLVTLTGPGGTGKTRLAIAAAAEMSDHYPDGVYWVPLAALADPLLVLDAAAKVLNASGDVAATIADRRLLVLFDNFEHLMDAADGVGELLASCPQLTVMVTSRERLHLTGEQEYPVPGLAPDDSVQFFVARARSVVPDFAPTPAVTAICRRLDDLPLALELAAARVKVMTAEQLLDRLDQSLPLLTQGASDMPRRQRTLEATIAWSYDLLDADEQKAFRAMAVFAGGCTLDAAEKVTGADLDVLTSLVDKSQVRRTADRLWMLETVREFGLRQLQVMDEVDAVRLRHADYYLALARSANLTADSLDRGQRFELVRPEIDNLRAAIDWAADVGDFELAISIAVSLEQYWVTNAPNEGVRRLDRLLEQSDDITLPLRARALRVRGGATYITGAFDEGRRWGDDALELFRALGDDEAVAHMLVRNAVDVERRGDPDQARQMCEESLQLHRSPVSEAQACTVLATIAFKEGDTAEALRLMSTSAQLSEDIGFTWWQLQSLLTYAEWALSLGRSDEAYAPAAKGLELADSIGDRQGVAYGISLLAWRASLRGRAELAGRLWGALETESRRGPIGQWELDREELTGLIVSEDPQFEFGRKQGLELTIREAVDEAVGSGD